MRGDRNPDAPPHGAVRRRAVAALLAAIIAFYGTLAFSGAGPVFADPGICRSQPADGAGDAGHALRLCLFCLPGCASLAAAAARVPDPPPLRFSAPADVPAAEAAPTHRRHQPYRPRGPPA